MVLVEKERLETDTGVIKAAVDLVEIDDAED